MIQVLKLPNALDKLDAIWNVYWFGELPLKFFIIELMFFCVKAI